MPLFSVKYAKIIITIIKAIEFYSHANKNEKEKEIHFYSMA